MSPLIYLASAVTFAAVTAMTFAMVITALKPRYVPRALHRLQRRMQAHMAPQWIRQGARDEQGQPLQEDGLAIFDELVVAEHEHEFAASGAAELREFGVPTLTSAASLPEAEALLFLRAEIAVQLDIDLVIRGTVVNLTPREYRRLLEFTAFAFDIIETPESYLGRYGITEIYFVPKRRSNRAPNIY